MTLVATLALDNHPILIGDLLISQMAHPADDPIALPTGVDDFRGKTRSIAGLDRKLTLISKRCVLGWACNNVETAKEVIESIRALESAGKLSVDSIDAAIKKHPRADHDRLSILGWYVEGDNLFGQITAHEIKYYATDGKSSAFTEVRAIGSGTKIFFETLELLDATEYESIQPLDEVTAKRAQWLGRVFNLVGTLFAAEHRQGNLAKSLEMSFGGGYEIALWEKGQFVFVSGYSITVWNARVASEVTFTVPPLLVANMYYRDDFLIIDTDRLKDVRGNGVQLDAYRFILTPFAKSGANLSSAPPPRIEFHVHAIHATNEKNEVAIGSIVEFSGPEALPRARLISLDKEKTAYSIEPDFAQEMDHYTKRMFAS